MASSILASVPIVIAFALVQTRFVQGFPPEQLRDKPPWELDTERP